MIAHWAMNQTHGPFTFIFNDGAKIEGECISGQNHGKCTTTDPDGTTYFKNYEYGEEVVDLDEEYDTCSELPRVKSEWVNEEVNAINTIMITSN